MRFNITIFLFISSVFAQPVFEQIEIKSITRLNIPYAGKITLSSTINAADGLYREEVQSEYDRFYVRMMAGGNKTAGKLIDQSKELLIMYDMSDKEFASEEFEVIRNNSGKPTLKDVTNMSPGGGGNRNQNNSNEDRDDDNDSNEEESSSDEKPTIERTVSSAYEMVNGFKCKKITTRISRDGGYMQMQEWITPDTSFFIFVNNIEKNVVESYDGSYSKTPSSNDWVSRIDPDRNFEIISGEVVKNTMEMLDEEGETSFSMDMEILSVKRVPYDSLKFTLPEEFKLVDQLD